MANRVHPRYAEMDFEEWDFREFPMMVYPGATDPRKPDYHKAGPKKGQLAFPGVIVKDDDELASVLGGSATVEGGRVQTPEDERLALIQKCQEAGVQFDKRWGVAKLQDALDTAGAGDADDDTL